MTLEKSKKYEAKMSSLSHGTVIRVAPDKPFGFIKIGKTDYFFHRDNFNGSWGELQKMFAMKNRINVTCAIVESTKGPRVENVTIVPDESLV